MISWKRFFDWIKILYTGKITLPQWIKIIRASIRLLFNGRVTRPIWRARIKTCTYCPIYDIASKRCQPMERPELGCGCYTPYLALVKENKCWGSNEYGINFGWKI